jgi:predicted secreted Zn-dependent protease
VAFKPNKGPIQEVVLKLGYTITMPKWSGYNDAKKPCKEAWDKMFSSLEKHEEGHRLILLEEAAIFGEKVTSQKDLDTKKLAELLKDFSPSVDKAQKKYDDATESGAKKGVFLPAPDQCK